MTYFLEIDGKRYDATDEQIAIIDAAKNTSDNLIINALAGAAKSTTLQFICKYVTGIPILSLAFNKRIAEELGKKLPSHVQCMTLNSLGHRTWATAVGKRLTLDTDKSRRLFKSLLESVPKREQSDYWDEYQNIMSSVRMGVTQGWIPDHLYRNIARLTNDETFRELISYEVFNADVSEHIFDFICRIFDSRIDEAYRGIIDFDDQIYMPTLFGGTWPKFPLVMVDESQDLSNLNHAMLRKLVAKRVIAVGDPWQSIYGFRGAVSSGMDKLKRTFEMKEFTLSVTFRCPKEVVRRAWSRVPHMKWPEWAIEGEVLNIQEPNEDHWSSKSIPDGAAIICRNNAPLFATALHLIKNGRGVKLIGADIGPALVKLLKKLGPESLTAEQVHVEIDKWEAEQLKKAKNPGSIADRAECLHIFAGAGPTLAAAIAYATHLFESAGPIQLLSGHKSKGLEWDTVYHLDPWRVPSKYAESREQKEQELNLRYVVETRARKTLILANLEDLLD